MSRSKLRNYALGVGDRHRCIEWVIAVFTDCRADLLGGEDPSSDPQHRHLRCTGATLEAAWCACRRVVLPQIVDEQIDATAEAQLEGVL